MNRTPIVRIFLALALLLLTTHRSPAPISEMETPTPTPAHTAKPKKSPKSKPAPSEATSSKPSARARPFATPSRVKFAGIWTGTLHGSAEGRVITIIVTADEGRATVKGAGGVWGDRTGDAKRSGNTLTWNFLAEPWTLVAAPDGRTASVSANHWPAGSSSGTMTKVQD